MPAGLEVHLIFDNATTHKTKLIGDWLRRRPRFHLHFTPTSSSWLNLVECWFALLTRRRLKRGVFKGRDELEKAIRVYIKENNKTPKPFVWTKTADAILASVGRFCKRTSTQTTRNGESNDGCRGFRTRSEASSRFRCSGCGRTRGRPGVRIRQDQRRSGLPALPTDVIRLL